MKKVAILLIVISLFGRVVCCGKSVDLNTEINQLSDRQNTLTKEIDKMVLTNSQQTSFTKALTELTTNVEQIPISYNSDHSSTIASSQ